MTEAQQSSAPDAADFPHVAPQRGRYYVTDDNFGGQMVICSHDTWVDFGTTLESLRQMAAAQDKRIKELLAQVAAAGLASQESERRLENLREVRRNEKRADIEGGIILSTSLPMKGR